MDKIFHLKKSMAASVKWVGSGQVSGYIIQFVVWVILARLLSPKDFGLLGLALAITNFTLIFSEMGIGWALVQRKELEPGHLNTAFWMFLFSGLVFLGVFVSSASLISGLSGGSGLYPLIMIFALKILVDSLGLVQAALLMRELRFKELTYIEVASSILFCFSALFLAYKGLGIVSVAYGYLLKSIMKLIWLWGILDFRPKFKFSRKHFAELFHYGRNIVGFKTVYYFRGNIDIFLIGKFLGAAALGYYCMALNLVNFPKEKLVYIISQVAFPAFSKLQERILEFRRAFLKLISYAAIFIFPLFVSLMILAPQFVHTIWTDKWSPIILPLRILCVYGICVSIASLNSVVFHCTGRPHYEFRLSLVNLMILLIALLLGFKYGLTGICAALTVYAVLMDILSFFFAGRIIKATLTAYLKAFYPAVICSAAMALGMGLFISFWQNTAKSQGWALLACALLFGLSIYLAVLFLVNRRSFMELADIAREIFFTPKGGH